MNDKIATNLFVEDYINLYLTNRASDFWIKYKNKYEKMPPLEEILNVLVSPQFINKLIDKEDDIRSFLLLEDKNQFKVIRMIPDDRRIVIGEEYFNTLEEAVKYKCSKEIRPYYFPPK